MRLLKTLLMSEKLCCSIDTAFWIAATLEWKAKEPASQPLSTQNKNPQLLGQLLLDIKLTTTLPAWARTSALSKKLIVNEHVLTEKAFYENPYTITLEKGNFIKSCQINIPRSNQLRPRHALRLIFDKPPFPPRCEWRDPGDQSLGIDANHPWDHVEFVARSSEELEARGRAMNDVFSVAAAVVGNCSVA